MSEYVNNSNVNIATGINAPSVHYEQIRTPNQPMSRPITDPGGKIDWATTAKSLLGGAETSKKEANEVAKNAYAQEVRKLTAAAQQGNLTPTAYSTAVRAAGDRALAAGLSADDVATIESKHSFGYLSTAQKERDQRMKDALEWDKKAVENFAQNSPMFSLSNDYEGANKTLAGFRTSKQAADMYLQQYMATGNEGFKPYAVRGMSDLWVKNFNLTLGNMLAQGQEPTQADVARIMTDTTHKMTVAGYPKDFVDEAVNIAMNSSNLKMYADIENTTRTFTRKQLEDINKIRLESIEAAVYDEYPEWAVFKSIGIEREIAVGVLKDLPINEQDAVYKNFQGLITKGAEISRYVTQTKQGAAIPYKIINNTISNPASVTPTTNVNLMKGSLDTILRDNSGAAASDDPKQIEIASKNLSNISTKAVRDSLNKQLSSDDPNTVRQAQLSLDALDGIDDAKLALQLKSTHNSPWKIIDNSTAKNRLYFDVFTGELKLRKPYGFVEGVANTFYGDEFEDAVKEMNKIVKDNTGGDLDRIKNMYTKYFGASKLQSASTELSDEPLPETNLNYDNEERMKELREQNKDLGQPRTGQYSMSYSSTIAGAHLAIPEDYEVTKMLRESDNYDNTSEGLGKYDTNLGKIDEVNYQEWLKLQPENFRNDIDYDMRGYYKDTQGEHIQDDAHLSDKYKKPNHPTFSTESKYYKKGMWAGEWDEDGNFIIPLTTPKDRLQKLIQYWKNSDEQGVILIDNPKVEKELEKTEKEISRYIEQLNDEHESEDTKRLIRQELKRLNMKRNNFERQIMVDTYNE